MPIPTKVSTACKNPALRCKEESKHGFPSSPFMGGVEAGVPGSDLPPQASHTVHGHAAARVFAELGLQQVEPIFHYLAGRRRSIIERPILQGGGKVRGREKHCQTLGKNSGDCFLLRVMAFWTSAEGRWMRVLATGLAAQLHGDVAAV